MRRRFFGALVAVLLALGNSGAFAEKMVEGPLATVEPRPTPMPGDGAEAPFAGTTEPPLEEAFTAETTEPPAEGDADSRQGRVAMARAIDIPLTPEERARRLQASDLKGLSEAEILEKVGPLFTADMRETGVLASISAAQFILESAFGRSDLAQSANNCFGMKKSLSGNTWEGSCWDGVSVYKKRTKENQGSSKEHTITADFRKYPCVGDSIADHSAYLLGAMNGDSLRYAGLKGCTDYRQAAQIIKDGGYATDVNYVTKLCDIIERWDLTRLDE